MDNDQFRPQLQRRGNFSARQQRTLKRFSSGSSSSSESESGSGSGAFGTDFQPRALPDMDAEPSRTPPRRPVALPPVARSTFKTKFDGTALQQLHADVDRGGKKKVGKFKNVLEAAKTLSDARQGNDVPAAQQLLAALDKYCNKKRVDAYEKELAKGPKGDAKTKRKMEAAQQMRLEAKRLIEDQIDAQHSARDSRDPARREQAYEGHARDMAKVFGQRKAGAGSSDVQLVKNGEGKVAYAFKSIDGESDQTGMAKGAGAVREAMASSMSDALKDMSKGKLDFGFPSVALVDFDGKKGALIEGLQGVAYDMKELNELLTEEKITEAELIKRKTEFAAKVDKLPAKEVQKVLLCNFAMAQFDIKWDNMMVDENDQGVSARPFDAGAAFLDDAALKAGPGILDPGPGGPGYMLLYCPVTQKELKSASEPMDPDMVAGILSINVKKLAANLVEERQRLAKTHGLGDQVLDDKGMGRSFKSIEIMQDILGKTPTMTTMAFVAEYCDRLGELA